MITIKIIAGSTRPGRFNSQVASWVHEQTKAVLSDYPEEDFKAELVDLVEIDLPMYDEAMPAQAQQYEHPHIKKWANIIGEADGFVIVSPEYNHSITGALKNAIDYFYAEWNHKPVTFVSYGSEAGGSRAVEHLRAVAGELRMYDLRDQLLLPSYWNRLDENGAYQFSEQEQVTLTKQLNDLIFWSGQMKQARTELVHPATADSAK